MFSVFRPAVGNSDGAVVGADLDSSANTETQTTPFDIMDMQMIQALMANMCAQQNQPAASPHLVEFKAGKLNQAGTRVRFEFSPFEYHQHVFP